MTATRAKTKKKRIAMAGLQDILTKIYLADVQYSQEFQTQTVTQARTLPIGVFNMMKHILIKAAHNNKT
jgi:hypothetical protein